MAETISAAEAAGRLRAEHSFIALRGFGPRRRRTFRRDQRNSRVRLASLMDHAPGQRSSSPGGLQDLLSRQEEAVGCRIRGLQPGPLGRHSLFIPFDNRRDACRALRAAGIAIASQDDATGGPRGGGYITLGIALCRIPDDTRTANPFPRPWPAGADGSAQCSAWGVAFRNVSAHDLLADDALDILSSDYCAFSLLQAVFLLAERGLMNLPAAVRLVTANPAEAAGLDDRGRIEIGRRADLIRVRTTPDRPPLVSGVWREGVRVC